MRALRSLVPLALFVAGALPAVIFACDSSSSTLGSGPQPTGPTAEAGPTVDGAPIVTPVADAPSSFIVDAPPPDTSLPLNMVDAADIPEGGARVTPGVIACGSQPTCNAFAGVQCCFGEDGGSCVSTSVSCPPNSASTTCNESADCVVGKVCCGAVEPFDAGNVGLGAQCSATCAPPLPQLCRTNEECPDAGTCKRQKCSDGNQYEFCGIFSTAPDASVTFTCKAD